MDPFLSVLKSTLTQEEYNGYLKGSAAFYVLGVNSRKNNDCVFAAKQYMDELMKSGYYIPHKTENPGISLNENDKNAPEPDRNQTPSPKTTVGVAKLNVDEVRRLYIDKNISARECSKIFGISLSAFGRFLRKHKISKFPKKDTSVTGQISKTAEDAALDAAALAAARDILSTQHTT